MLSHEQVPPADLIADVAEELLTSFPSFLRATESDPINESAPVRPTLV